MLAIRVDSKMVVDWINGHAKLKTRDGTMAAAQNLLRKWWSEGIDMRRRAVDCAIHIFREYT